VTTPKGRGLARKTLELIVECQDILAEIQPASVRAVCYRLFVRKLIPDMSKNSTGKISRVLTTAREEGYIPWDWIVDENRELERAGQWSDPEHFSESVKRSYRRDQWEHQGSRVEVWSEKGTMRGTLKPVLDKYGVGFRVMHGFSSATTLNEIAVSTQRGDKPLVVFYLGDWDPSGMHMSEIDLPKRLVKYGATLGFDRLSLTSEDIHREELASLWFPASDKRGDSRYRWFVDNIGTKCWELDALSPVIIRDRIEQAILGLIDLDLWERYQVAEAAELESLNDVLTQWAQIKAA
jgi:hypothetical protein